METASPQRMTIIILGAVLLAAVAVGAVIYFTPTLNIGIPGIPVSQQADDGLALEGPDGDAGGFQTAVLSESQYTALDNTLFSRGLIPVQPPVGAGKQNLFQ